MGFFDRYPYTNWHNVNLDWVLQRVKEWGEMVEANNQAFQDLEAANESFKDYVTNYLQNLDVQEEINIKIDSLLESGVLMQYMQPYISNTVTDWLDDNITQPVEVVIDRSLTVDGAAANSKTVGDMIRANTFSENAKNALLGCLRRIGFTDLDYMTYYQALANEIINSPLDRIAYGNLTYRDIFITNNLCKIGSFEGNIVLSYNDTTLENGDVYRIKAGSPIISSEFSYGGDKSLKAFGNSSCYVQYVSRHIPKVGRLFCACSVYSVRVISGGVGIQPVIMNGATFLNNINVIKRETTEGFTNIGNILNLNYANYNDYYLYLNMGTISSPDADGYVDNVVATIIPDTMSLETAIELFNNYVSIIRGM